MTRIERCRVRILLALGRGRGRPDGIGRRPGAEVSELSERDARDGQVLRRGLRLRASRRDDPDARRREAAHRHPRAQGREERGNPAHAHALRRHRADDPHREPAPRADALRLRQRHRRDRRGRLHPRRPGHPRQVRLRGRLRDEPPSPRAAEPDGRRPRDRHVRHGRLAREKRPGVQRQGRHPRHLLRRVHAADGARQPAPGAQGLGPDEPDGRRLDGRRLVPQRRVPAAGHVLHLRAGGHAQERR